MAYKLEFVDEVNPEDTVLKPMVSKSSLMLKACPYLEG